MAWRMADTDRAFGLGCWLPSSKLPGSFKTGGYTKVPDLAEALQNPSSTSAAHLLCARHSKTCQYDLSFTAHSGHKRWGLYCPQSPKDI